MIDTNSKVFTAVASELLLKKPESVQVQGFKSWNKEKAAKMGLLCESFFFFCICVTLLPTALYDLHSNPSSFAVCRVKAVYNRCVSTLCLVFHHQTSQLPEKVSAATVSYFRLRGRRVNRILRPNHTWLLGRSRSHDACSNGLQPIRLITPSSQLAS